MWRAALARSKARGQSLVEMAFMLPLLLVVLFGIIEFGWLIFAYSTISQAARNGAEAAAQLPPYQSWIALRTNSPEGYEYRADDCVNAILTAVEDDLTIIGAGANGQEPVAQYVSISYPSDTGTKDTRNLDDRGPIEVTISYPVNGLTPLWSLLGMEDGITMRVTQRRSLENLGRDPTRIQGVACAKNLDDWKKLNPTTTP